MKRNNSIRVMSRRRTMLKTRHLRMLNRQKQFFTFIRP